MKSVLHLLKTVLLYSPTNKNGAMDKNECESVALLVWLGFECPLLLHVMGTPIRMTVNRLVSSVDM